MAKINFRSIYKKNQNDWKALTTNPEKYENLLAGHYSESNHFVYELLQNAEDENADRVVFEYYEDKLVFYHNGDPFDENDVRGVSSMLEGTKNRNSAQTIGRFGMGFKSVFKYTYQPEIYSDKTMFRIENYLLPVAIQGDWDYRKERGLLVYKLSDEKEYVPFSSQKHLTKIVIPFYKKTDESTLEKATGSEVLQKLQQLPAEILLFLNHIKKLYWVDKESGNYAMISLDVDKKDSNLNTCRIQGSARYGIESVTRYLKFSKTFNHPQMSDAEVSVAYRLNARAYNINEVTGQVPIWVYFPTRDMTKLPFYIHGSFETAVSREKLMTPSAFNTFLFEELGNLIRDTLKELKDRKLITQPFIRKVLLAAFRDEEENNTIPGLREKITDEFNAGAYLPDRSGVCQSADRVLVPVPHEICDFRENKLLACSFDKLNEFVAFNGEKDAYFNEYYIWLTEKLHVPVFSLDSWALRLQKSSLQPIEPRSKRFADLEAFYEFLIDFRQSQFPANRTYRFNANPSRYDLKIRESVRLAWGFLRQAPIVLNAAGSFSAPSHGNENTLYMSGSNDYKTLPQESVVHKKIATKYPKLMQEDFQIRNFDNFQYVKEKVIRKYIEGDSINFESDDYETEYAEDINQIIALFTANQNVTVIKELLSKACIIRTKTPEGDTQYSMPDNCYISRSVDGIDLATWFGMPDASELKESDDYEVEECELSIVDEDFYHEHDILLEKLYPFGVVISAIDEGQRSESGRPGQESWRALEKYCPHIRIEFLHENMRFIEANPHHNLAKKKSAELLKMLCSCSEKLAGSISKRKTNPYVVEEESMLLHHVKHSYSWLFNRRGELCALPEMSKLELDETVYGSLYKDKAIYTRLGFKETKEDDREETFEQVDKLNKKSKTILLKQLAKELGMTVSQADDPFGWPDEDAEGEETFNPSEWVSSDFPVSKVKNMDFLVEHVRQQFFCADPVKYEKVLRQIRTSKSPRTVRAYVAGMYTNQSNAIVCQICKQPTRVFDVTEIANFGIELPQVNLCLCKNCSARYKEIRDHGKSEYRKKIDKAIRSIEFDKSAEEYRVTAAPDLDVCFTETHIAELKTVLQLLLKYGKPEVTMDQ